VPGDGVRAMRALRLYVRAVDATNRVVGLFAMYLIFAMIGILFYSSISKTVAIPPLWALEMAQFTMTAYYILGGAYSLQLDSHVRMDLLYGRWSPRTRAAVDAFTVLLLGFYLVFLLYGGYSSTAYALEYDERSYSAWAPYMAPIKILMCAGILLMLLQTSATFLRNVAEARGTPLDAGPPAPAVRAEDVPGRETSRPAEGRPA
jgi:TRAP-type mannitol/chloroaromatic compound transport system permease small subunit